MEMFVNKVAASGIQTLDLAPYCEPEIIGFDLQPHLFRGLILKEKDFREALKTIDLQPFTGKQVAVYCSVDAIVPVWAYALVAVVLHPVAAGVHFGVEAAIRDAVIAATIRREIDPTQYEGARLVLKGCGDVNIPPAAYIAATDLLQPVVQSLMFGEPCSTVPLYKKKAAPAAG
ncbi:MAG: DUF2480 family protein [Sphingobacteriales bacterium]|nr:MAG: DUF2480 family protein [Sphingobacteriales bacterium]